MFLFYLHQIKLYIIVILLTAPFLLFSQSLDFKEENSIFDILQQETENSGMISIYQDTRIENLVLQHIEKNKQTAGIPGYRINIFFESGLKARQNAFAARDTFDKYYNIPSYVEYQTPNYKVYVGDFRTKVEAERFLEQIKRRYPRTSFIVPMRINYPEIIFENN